MPHSKPSPVLIFISFICFGLVSCNGCKTKPDIHDSTPPTIEWTVDNRTTGVQSNFTGTGKLNLPAGSDIVITACVVDDGGVKEISSYSNSSFTCREGDIAQSTGPGLAVVETSPLGLDENGLAWKRFCRLYSLKLNFACSAGFTLTSGSAFFNLTGKNYAGLTATGSLSLMVTR